MMKRRLVAVMLVALLLLWALPVGAQAGTARDTIEKRVNAVLDVLRDPALKNASKAVRVSKIEALVHAVFDWQRLSRLTLGRGWKKFNPDQRQKFQVLFAKLLEGVYMDRILAYTDEKIVFGQESALSKTKVEVKSNIVTSKGQEIPLNYRMIEKDGQWKVYDVIIEGISMVRNYRSQFRQILAKQTPDDLLKIMEKKVQQNKSA